MRGLSDRTALVTGAGRGIGRAIARRLADDGATVAVNDVDAAAAERVAERIADEGGDAVAVPADVTDFEAVEAMVETVEAERDVVDTLVNNAGRFDVEWFLEEDPGTWSDLLEVNLLGQAHCARVVAERLVATETRGTIVGLSSDAGRNGNSGQAMYAGTKAGVIGLTKSLAREFARYGITCNAVAPGPTETEGLEAVRADSDLASTLLSSVEEGIPLGRTTEPNDVAGVVAFLASDDAAFLTGQVISVSGGLTMND